MKRCRRSASSNSQPGPTWQDYHASVVHHICQGIARGLKRGGSVRGLAAQASRRWNGKPFKRDTARKFSLSAVTITRLFYQWRRGGELPCAVRLRYHTIGHPSIPAPVMVRFLLFCAASPWPSLKAAWTAFARRPGSFTRARSLGKGRVQYAYATVWRYFPLSQFRAIQATIKTEADAKTERARLVVASITEIRRRLPDRPKRIRRTRAEVSLEASGL